MAVMTAYEPGTPSWIDLATTDLAGAKLFYAGLFGWSLVEMPSPEGPYCMFSKEGATVAAAYQMTPDTVDNGIPPHWATYVTVANIDDTLAVIREEGGTVVQEPHRVPGAGRTAAVQDPSAAVFALWEPDGHIGAERVNEPGALYWNELQSYDTDSAKAFYEAVMGWSAETTAMPTGEYTTFMRNGQPVAGMMAIQPQWGPVPPNWSIYLGVADIEEACAYAANNQGRVEMPPMSVPEVGTFALLRDPQGAYFYVLEGS